MTPKSLANIRSDFLAAVRARGLKTGEQKSKAPLSPAWSELMGRLSSKRLHIGLSRLARFASANETKPSEIDDTAIEKFIAAVREGSLHRKPDSLHRSVALIWNEVGKQTGLNLLPVRVPSFRRLAKRTEWTLLPNSFRTDVEAYLNWCAGSDPFAADARTRALAPRTLRLRRDQIHAAATALVESGAAPAAVTSLADLVSPDALKRILRRRLAAEGGSENSFNRDLGEALVQMAREWVKVDAVILAELKRLVGKMPMPASGLTEKNKRFLRQFDDPAALRRLFGLPKRLWSEVRRDQNANFRTLAKAQASLAVAILSYMPIRLQNLATLEFGKHLFLKDAARATSTLELSAGEVKNREQLAFDIPPHIARMLIEYRDRIAPKIIGHRPERLFVNSDGSAKSQATVAWLISNYLKRRAGIVLTPHQFRHLSAKVLLDAEPGSFETVRQFLGHKSLKTTVAAYTGIDSRRAARHHQRLVEQALAAHPVPGRLRRNRRNERSTGNIYCAARPKFRFPLRLGPKRTAFAGMRRLKPAIRSMRAGQPLISRIVRVKTCITAIAASLGSSRINIPSGSRLRRSAASTRAS